MKFPPNLVYQAWYSGSNEPGVAPEQLELLRDLSLADSKAPMILEQDTGMSGTDEKAMLSIKSPRAKSRSKGDDEEQSSSGDWTPGSEDCDSGEESTHLNTDDIDIETFVETLKGPLDKLFQEWLGGIRCGDDASQKSSSSTSPPPARSDSQPSQKSKRKRVANAETEDTDTESEKIQKKQKRPRNTKPLGKKLACPYFKRDSRRHWNCCGCGFNRIRDMKQHLKRRHAILFCCPVCHRSFDTMELRNDHIRERLCELAEDHQAPDGITPERMPLLSQRVPSKLSEEDQWFHVFDFLFPGHPRPRSAYNNTEFSESLLNFRDFISQPAAHDILLQTVRENPAWTPELEAIFRPDLVHSLNQLYWRWAATQGHETDEAPAILSPPRDPGVSPAQSTNGETSVPSAQLEPEADSSEGGNSQGPENSTPEASADATPAIAQDLQNDEELRLDNAQALVFADYELEERKVDEGDQMPPRQINHEGIAPVPEQHQHAPADLLELDFTEHSLLEFTNSFEYEFPAAQHAVLNPFDDIGVAEGWISDFDYAGHEAFLPMGGLDGSPVGESPVDLGATGTGQELGMIEGEEADSGEYDDFIIVTHPST